LKSTRFTAAVIAESGNCFVTDFLKHRGGDGLTLVAGLSVINLVSHLLTTT
jgi:hypothetical protein